MYDCVIKNIIKKICNVPTFTYMFRINQQESILLFNQFYISFWNFSSYPFSIIKSRLFLLLISTLSWADPVFFYRGGRGILPRGRGAPGPINAIFGNFTMWIQFLRWNLPGGWSNPLNPPDSLPLLDPRTIALKKWLTTLYFLLMLWSRRDQTCQCRLWRGTIQTVQTEAGHYWRGAVGRVGKQGTTRRQKRTPTLTMATPKGPVSITFCLILRYL